MKILNKKNIWIGLAEVCISSKKGKNNLNGFTKGFVNVLAFARNRYDFRKKVKFELKNMDLSLKRLEDAELYRLRVKKFHVDEKLKEIASNINEDNSVQFGDFYVFKE